MQLPQALLDEVQAHPCLTGCYSDRTAVNVCIGIGQPLEKLLVADCEDCLSHYVGVPRSLVASSGKRIALGRALTRHVMRTRGFDLAFSGYHAVGPRFWLSGVYYASFGVFLLDGHRSRSTGSDLDLLMLAMVHGVFNVNDPHMLDPNNYRLRDVHLSVSQPLTPAGSLGDLLALPQVFVSAPAGQRTRKVTLAEYMPVGASAAAKATRPSRTAQSKRPPAPTSRPLRIGEVCPVCNSTVRRRPLLNGTYVGCKC